MVIIKGRKFRIYPKYWNHFDYETYSIKNEKGDFKMKKWTTALSMSIITLGLLSTPTIINKNKNSWGFKKTSRVYLIITRIYVLFFKIVSGVSMLFYDKI